MTQGCEFTEEMTSQILSWLQPKTLMRFKCVHKSWCTLIKDPKFVAKHLSKAWNNNLHTTCLLYKRYIKRHPDADDKETDCKFSLLNFCNDSDGGDEYDDIHYVVEDIRKDGFEILDSGLIMGNCDGIICLMTFTEIILWNPATRDLKITTPEAFIPNEKFNILGIGYDPRSKSHKVVNIYTGSSETYGDQHLLFDAPRIDVYTLGTDSWRQIMTHSLETETTNFCPDIFERCFKGFCYWFGQEQLKEYQSVYDQQDDDLVIISFDMGDEVFHRILYPDSLYDSSIWCSNMRIIEWNESIALVGQDEDSWGSWGLWAKEDFSGVKGSWIKHFSFPKTAGIEKPLYFWKRDEILMVSEEGHLISYNLDTEKLKHLPRHSMDLDECEAFVYVNNIIPILNEVTCYTNIVDVNL